MMRHHVILRAVLILLVCGTSTAVVVAQQATVFPFLRGTLSARAAGLAGSTVAMTNDISMIVVNPASLATLEEPAVTGTFIKHVLDINSGYAAYGAEIEDVGHWGVTASFTSYGSFDRTDASGVTSGSFGANDLAIAGTFSKHLDTLISYGVTLKVLHSTLDNMASTAVAVDAGLLFQIPDSRTNVGISLLNAGAQLSTYDGTADRLPIDLRIGVNHRLKGLPLLVNASLNHLTDDVDSFFDRFLNFSIGGELYIGKAVRARVGYDNATRNLSGVNVATQLTGVSGGIGVYLETFNIDYALSSLGSSAFLHRLSLGLNL